jgi:uncharacterized protein (DUF362 family)
MDRRAFFKAGLGASALAGTALAAGTRRGLRAGEPGPDGPTPHLVAVRGGEPDVMFDRGIKALGGIGAFMKQGQTVVVKPNIGWDVSPERAGNTHPKLVSRIVKACYEAGAKKVYVFDHTCDDWQRCYATSGIERAAKDAGAVVVAGNSESYYQDVRIPGGIELKDAKEHELILSSDVFINVPVLKSHSGARLTVALKNLMGIVWDRGFWHKADLHQCIADYATYRRPTLNVVDAYYVMKRNGPRGVSVEDVTMMKSQILTTDMVAADAAAAKLFGMEPDAVRHIALAADRKVGRKDLENLTIERITI